MKISACMIVKNEKDNIEKCINSYKEITDEIIVVDTGSEDNTAEAAEKMGAKVYFREWDDDFGAAKNFALEHASGTWVIFLDADEYFAEGASAVLKKIIAEADSDKGIEAIQCRLYNIDSKTGNIMEEHPTVRIFRNEPQIRFEGRIHEAPKKNGRFLRYRAAKEIAVYHTGYSPEIVDQKIERNIKLLEKEIKSGNSDAMLRYYLCESCSLLNRHEEAIRHAEIFMHDERLNEMIVSMPQAFRVYFYKINAMIALKYKNESIHDIIMQGLARFPFHPEFKIFEAEYYLNTGQIDDAEKAYLESIELYRNYNSLYSTSYGAMLDDVLYKLGEINLMKNRTETAFDYFMESLAQNKYKSHSLAGLLSLIVGHDPSEIIRFLNSIYDENRFEDVKFLASGLAKKRMKAPFLHYFFNKWKGGYEEFKGLALLASVFAGNTLEVAETALLLHKNYRSEQYKNLFMLSLIYGNHRNWYESHKTEIPDEYIKILEIIFERKEHKNLNENDKEMLGRILSELIALRDWSALKRLMEAVPYFEGEGAEEAGLKFMENGCYDEALNFLFKAAEHEARNAGTMELHYNLGYCLFKKKRYEEGAEYLEAALSAGWNRDYMPVQLLKWIKEAASSDLRRRCGEIIRKYEGNVLEAVKLNSYK